MISYSLSKIKYGLLLFALLGLSACGSGSSSSGGSQAPSVPLVGPDLHGDTWQGSFTNLHGVFIPVTAIVTHIGDDIIIQTSLPDSGIASRLVGKISSGGSMLLYDEFDGEDWTTLHGPASANSIKIADFVFINGQNTDTNNIVLTR